ncbi:MAG: saccharopine dehydrogenase family protein [Acidobacteriota bacterium]
MRIVVLGAGLVGGPMAADLAADDRFEVTAADVSEAALARLRPRPRIATLRRDLSDPQAVRELATDFDLVISCVPGSMGFATLEAVIRAGRDVVDIAFFPEDPFALSELARRQGVTAVVDCGVAPGMSHLLAGHADRLLDETETVLIYVGGLPQERKWPFEYKAGFSPTDVIEEYLRPARYVENGNLVVRPALSDPEIVHFPGVGSLEAFNTDGLRTLLATLDVPNMKEKTLRYPGHIEHMAVLRAAGFFDREEIEVRGAPVRPLDVTAHLLGRSWKLEEGDVDLTLMRVIVEGKRAGRQLRYTWELFDRYDERTGVHSMARTTGYTATVVARLLAEGLVRERGVIAPEHIGRDEACVEYVLRGLAERGVLYEESVEEPDGREGPREPASLSA